MSSSDGAPRPNEVERLLAEYAADLTAVTNEDLIELRGKARAAIDRLDDEPEFDAAHRALDGVGQLIRRHRPALCFLAEDSGGYTQKCPVALGHIRLGLSVGMEIQESHCSICGEDLWTCPHIPGKLYGGEPVIRVITKAKLIEVSVVDRPNFADARFISRSVSRAEVEERLGGPLPAGAHPVCDRCLTPCRGIRATAA